MALSTTIKHSADGGVLTLKDGTGTPLTLNVRFDRADLQISGLSKQMRESVVYEGRGKVRSIRYGKVKVPTVQFSFEIAELSEATVGTVLDWIHKTTGSPFAARVNTNTHGEVDTQTLLFTMEGTDLGDAADQTIEVTLFEIQDYDLAEGEPNVGTVRGRFFGDYKVNGATLATVPRVS